MVTSLLPKVSSGDPVNAPGVQYFPGKKIEMVWSVSRAVNNRNLVVQRPEVIQIP
jgi:hypothetical protein